MGPILRPSLRSGQGVGVRSNRAASHEHVQDVNNDGVVDAADAAQFFAAWSNGGGQ